MNPADRLPPPVKRQNEEEEGVVGTREVHKRVPATVQLGMSERGAGGRGSLSVRAGWDP